MASAPELRVSDDPAVACAESIARRLRDAVRRRGSASLAVSGGSSAPPMFAALARLSVPWNKVGVWQVDERVAPDGDPDRNATQLVGIGGRQRLMPVTATDLGVAARRYAGSLPDRFDVVHLGMGPDGHTASWPPGDPVIDSRARVALSGEYQGRVRMTLTPQVVNGARGRAVLLLGADKSAALAAWLRPGTGPTPPIARVRGRGTVIFCDPAAAAGVQR